MKFIEFYNVIYILYSIVLIFTIHSTKKTYGISSISILLRLITITFQLLDYLYILSYINIFIGFIDISLNIYLYYLVRRKFIMIDNNIREIQYFWIYLLTSFLMLCVCSVYKFSYKSFSTVISSFSLCVQASYYRRSVRNIYTLKIILCLFLYELSSCFVNVTESLKNNTFEMWPLFIGSTFEALLFCDIAFFFYLNNYVKKFELP